MVGVPFTEREEISRGLRGELSLRSIARFLKRPPSTINREVRRNGGAKDYRAARSDAGLWTVLTAQSPASRQAGDAYPCRAISGKLTRKWPPQQIAGWLMREHPDEEGKRVSLGTIYRSLFIQTRAYLRRNYRHTCERRDPFDDLAMRLCRKYSQRLKAGRRRTQLCCQGRKLLEWRYAGLVERPLADHVCGFDPSQCSGG